MKQRHTPIRSCVVCRQTSDKRALLRVVRLPERDGGMVVVDVTGKKPGRGAYICPDEVCVDKAIKGKRFERALAVTPGNVEPGLYETLKSMAAANADQAVAAVMSEKSNSSLRSDPPMK
jgi:predicted RNA-binding protein YlxR (DUF448 family)